MAKGTGITSPVLFVLLTLTLFVGGCASDPQQPINLSAREASVADTPMVAAVRAGDLERVQALAADGASLNTVTEAGTPLTVAVTENQDRIAWYLLSEGANPERAGSNGETALMVAAENGSRRLVQLLLSAGARVNATDAAGSTPVIRAAGNGHLSVVKVLLAAGANVNVSQDGRSLLMHIVDSGDMLTAEMLLAAGADVNYRSERGVTALDVARENGNRDLEMLLIQAGAEL
ncbi:ankyrin repeat domain-containing protein [Marinobacter lipolyticus]|uniref:ankyrin repeat domain-containing protein n=1 Tax=Marinobacter lipolyticus TaxID=209639 RepID=UPI001BCD0EFA|nr:ankyrin repeat domain-containing protein [Marinobacter lipolyticus]MBS8240472.1 ankyrin repeat domain-containing protein [Marinobacter lipolyticus]